MLMTPLIMGITINTVPISPYFREFLYSLTVAVFLVSIIILIIKKREIIIPVRKAIIITFFISGILYAVYGEICWLRWLIEDWHRFSERTTEEKLLSLEGPIYSFSRAVKDIISDEDYDINMQADYFSLRTQYFLLPSKKRENARFFVILADSGTHFDPSTGILTADGRTIENLELFYQFAPDAYILRRR